MMIFIVSLYPDSTFSSTGPLDNVEHLLQLDIKPIYGKINKVNNKNKECFGLWYISFEYGVF